MILALDSLRRETWRVAARTRLGRFAAKNTDFRLASIGAGHLAVAFALAALFPHWLLLIGPLVLGVPHVLADVRLLLARGPLERHHRMRLWALLLPIGAMLVLRCAQTLGADVPHSVDVACGGVALVLAAALWPRSLWARLLVLVLGAGAAALALEHWWGVALGFAHGHNLVALVVFVTLAVTRRHIGASLTVLLLAAAGSAALWWGAAAALGGLERSVTQLPLSGLGLADLARSLAPDLAPDVGLRVVTVYAFLQAAHYTLWLRLNPAVWPGQRSAPSSFERDAREWREALGTWPAAAAALLCVAVPVVALLDAPGTRTAYLTVASFHGWMELAVLLHWAGLRRAARAAPLPA